jgi:hypothetical protein
MLIGKSGLETVPKIRCLFLAGKSYVREIWRGAGTGRYCREIARNPSISVIYQSFDELAAYVMSMDASVAKNAPASLMNR